MSDPDNVPVSARRVDPAEIEARFQALVQSPLRAGLLRFLCARPEESFEVEALMQTFGRMRLDVENCMRELVAFGVAGKMPAPARRATHSSSPPTTSFAICSTNSSSVVPRSATKIAPRRCSVSAK